MKTTQRQVLEQLVRRATEAIAAGERQLVVRLDPASLGIVKLTLAVEDGSYTVKIAAQRQRTERLIESDLECLRQAFQTVLAQLSAVPEPDDLPPAC